MTSPTALPPKKDVALALLESSTVFVHLDPRVDDVRVPQWFKKQPQLVLQIGLNMPVPIQDLNVDEQSVSCTLSFNRSPFFCFIPWTSVYALVGEDGRGMVWPDDVPPEVAAQAASQQQQPQAKPEQRAHLRAVPDKASPADVADVAEAAPPADARPKRKAAKKRTRKKAQPGQAKLASVDAAPEPPRPVADDEPAEKASGDGKGKRKLPPYLRIVK